MVKKVKHPVMESPKKKGLFRKKEEQNDVLLDDNVPFSVVEAYKDVYKRQLSTIERRLTSLPLP